MLDLSRPDLASLEFDRSVVLDRVLRALKFRDQKGLVCEAACTALPLPDMCGHRAALPQSHGTQGLTSPRIGQNSWPVAPPTADPVL